MDVQNDYAKWAKQALLVQAGILWQPLVVWFYTGNSGCVAGLFMAVGVFGIVDTLYLSRKVARRSRVIALAALYSSLIVLFASIYYFVYLHDPTAYAFSSQIEPKQIQGYYTVTYKSLLKECEFLLVLARLYEQPDVGMTAIRDERTEIELPMEKGGGGHAILFCSRYASGMSLVIPYMHVEYKGYQWDLNLTQPTNTRDQFRTYVEDCIKTVNQEKEEDFQKLRDALSARRQWGFLDFLYFSTVTITTLGYGDIIPNTRIVRMITMSQTFVGVFFVAYAVSLLWPRPARFSSA
jgi:hypothetical protein